MTFQVFLSDINILRSYDDEKLILIIFIINQSNEYKNPAAQFAAGPVTDSNALDLYFRIRCFYIGICHLRPSPPPDRRIHSVMGPDDLSTEHKGMAGKPATDLLHSLRGQSRS